MRSKFGHLPIFYELIGNAPMYKRGVPHLHTTHVGLVDSPQPKSPPRERRANLDYQIIKLLNYALIIPFRIAYLTNSARECRFNLCMIFSR